LALRVEVSEGIGFLELVERVRSLALEAYSHQDVPFEKLVDELRPHRSLSHSPLFQVLFVLLHPGIHPGMGPGAGPARAAELGVPPCGGEQGTSKSDLPLSLFAEAEDFTGFVEYATDLFDGAPIRRFTRHFASLAEAVTADPEADLAGLP